MVLGSSARHCPALLVSAPASGQGKTTVTAALARAHRRAGRQVRVFKAGPDFLDPMVLEHASGAPVYQLDLFMGGTDHCRRLLYEAATADLILVEGVMGLHDGAPSSADLARRFGLPVLAVIDAAAMAQTFGALVQGLAQWREGVQLTHVVANRVAGAGHHALLCESLPEGVRSWGHLPADADAALPERHLGLMQAAEIADLDQRLDRLADALCPHPPPLPEPVALAPGVDERPAPLLAGCRVAVACDAAFAFIYPANIDTLRALGASVHCFSPLADTALPPCDALWLPGGYPELHLRTLAGNPGMHSAIRAHHDAGRPILAECGGLLYLLDELTHADGTRAPMLGLLPGRAQVGERLAGIGLQAVTLPEGPLRGHSFHHARLVTPLAPIGHASNPNDGPTTEAVYRRGRLTASFMHGYFASAPATVAALLQP